MFVELGFDAAEAEVMKLRAEVMLRMKQLLKEKGWTQAEAARRLGVTQPRISRLVKGKWEDFSLDMLLTLVARAGLHPQLHLAAWDKHKRGSAAFLHGSPRTKCRHPRFQPPPTVNQRATDRRESSG